MLPIRFILVFVLLYSALALMPEQVLEPVNRLFAQGAGLLLEAWGVSTSLEGDTLIADGFHARVIDECTPLFMLLVFSSFLAACQADLRKKGMALLLAALFFSSLTVVRIAFLVLVGARFPAQFHSVHTYLAQSLMMMAVIFAAVVWLRWEQGGLTGLPILSFVSRFLLWSSLLFLAWLPVNSWYMQQVDRLLVVLFKIFGHQLAVSYGHAVYFQTFNLVTFGSLMLASRVPGGQSGRRQLAAGLTLLMLGHLLVRFGNSMATAFNMSWGFPFATSVSIAGQYPAPFLLWWIMVISPVDGRGKAGQAV